MRAKIHNVYVEPEGRIEIYEEPQKVSIHGIHINLGGCIEISN